MPSKKSASKDSSSGKSKSAGKPSSKGSVSSNKPKKDSKSIKPTTLSATQKQSAAKRKQISSQKPPVLSLKSKGKPSASSETIDFQPTPKTWPKTRYESLSTWQILMNEADNELRKPYPIYSYAEHKLFQAIRAMAPVCSYETEFASAIAALANLYYHSNRYSEAKATIQQLDKLYQAYSYDDNDMCFVFEIIASEYNRLGLYDDAIRVCHDVINQIERQAHDKGIILRKGQDLYDEDDWVSDESERFNRLIKYANKAKVELQRNKETIDTLSDLRKR